MFRILFLIPLVALLFATPARAQEGPEVVSRYYSAHVTQIVPQVDVADGNESAESIIVELHIDSKPRKGEKVAALWSNNQGAVRSFSVAEGSKLLINCTTINGEETCSIVEQQRMGGLIALCILFLGVVWYVTRKHGMKAVLGILIGLVVILFVIIPLIIRGLPPLPVTIVGGLAILVPSLYISHGVNMKTHIALGSILVAVIFIGVVSLIFTNILGLIGTTGEEATYLAPNINLKSILVSGILLGALGVIDDVAMTQVAIVNELHHSNKRLSALALFKRAMQVGQDHIASVINTLFLAYAGIALPLLILINQNDLPFFVAVQQEHLAAEIMRTLIGTMGLILVVPLATFIAAKAVIRWPEKFPDQEHHHIH